MSDHEFYEKDGLEYARVSTILGKTMPIFYPQRATGLAIWQEKEPDYQEILAKSQRRGTIVHYMVEKYILDHSIKHCDDAPTMEEILHHNIPAYMNFLEPFLKELKDSNAGSCDLWPGLAKSNVVIEQTVYCPYGFAGTPDLKCWFNQKYSIVDWKSVRSHLEDGVEKKRKPRSKFSEGFVQLGAYALDHNIRAHETGEYPPVEQVIICACYDWCEPTLFIQPINKVKELADEFIERFKVYQEIEDSSFPRPSLISL